MRTRFTRGAVATRAVTVTLAVTAFVALTITLAIARGILRCAFRTRVVTRLAFAVTATFVAALVTPIALRSTVAAAASIAAITTRLIAVATLVVAVTVATLAVAAATAIAAITSITACVTVVTAAAITVTSTTAIRAVATAIAAITTITGLFLRCTRFTEEPFPDTAEDTLARARHHGRGRRGRSGLGARRVRWGRFRRHQRRHRRLLVFQQLLLGALGGYFQFHHFAAPHFMAAQRVFLQTHLVVAHATQDVVRGIEGRVRHQNDANARTLFHSTQVVALFVHEERRHFHGQLRDDLGGTVLAGLFADETQHRQRQAFDTTDGAEAVAARALHVGAFFQRRAQALAGHFQQAEARDAANLDAGAVLLHGIAEAVFHSLLVLQRLHVDEVDDDETAEVAQAQLTSNFVCGFQVGVGGRGLDVRALGGAGRVDVDSHQRFGVVDDEATARGQVHLVAVGAFDLVFDLVAREQRHVVLVGLQLAQVFRRHEALHVFAAAFEGGGVVHHHFADVIGQVVAQGTGDRVAFLVDEERGRAVLRGGGDGIPVGAHVVEVPLEFLGAAAHAGGTHDGTHAVGNLQRVHGFARHFAVFAFNAARHATSARVVRH